MTEQHERQSFVQLFLTGTRADVPAEELSNPSQQCDQRP
jgi:hypothetical protein